MDQSKQSSSRRDFLKNTLSWTAGATFAASGWSQLSQSLLAQESSGSSRIALGFDNFSIRALGWKASRLLDYAAEQKMDYLMFSDLDVYESLESCALRDVKMKADDLGIKIHAGTGGVCATSSSFRDNHGTGEEHLALTIKVAKALGSPVARCYLGGGRDRQGEGGIWRHMKEMIKTLKAVRSQAVDAGVKIAVENHAGDMQAWELVQLIEEAGSDFVGATMDSGNATWTIEDPIASLEILAPYAASTGIRDSAVWDKGEGIGVAWTAVGEGSVDFKEYVQKYAAMCPETPFILEIISGIPRDYPVYGDPSFWDVYPKARAKDFARFVELSKKGSAYVAANNPQGATRKETEQLGQLAELERSIKYCKETLGLGLKS